ncbi:alpha/beta hydrolase family protein [Roseobacter sp. GAI101]|uniref:alpha/beta hydrolase family protein n=1 Tax=Roseobacter sp. (strain GAI101) TaxID=391589 RepID=UPI000187152D|nr:hypothetical protein [Roseobacter sp. GAI101]EEB83538.1 conserved hypothetical protein [Roseobacter sp. GAI101]
MTMPWSAKCDTYDVAVSTVPLADDTGGTLSLTLRYPHEGKAKAVVIFCHGLGSSGAAYGGLAEAWVKQGYVVIQPTFADSIFEVARAFPELGLDPQDEDLVLWARKPSAIWQKMFQILHDPDYWLDRIRIVNVVMDQLPDLLQRAFAPAAGLPLAIAGHSFGAYTAQLLAGVEIDLPDGPRNFRDDRFAAALVLSGQGRDQQGLRDGSWDDMTGPVLTVTGKQDGGAKGQDWHWKCEPFDLAPSGGKVLAVLGDANHYLGGMTPEGVTVPHQFEALSMVTTAFLDAYVRQRASARNWLALVEDRIGNCPVVFSRK